MGKVLTITSLIGGAVLGYAIYFDYKRRSSPEFRKALKKRSIQQKKQSKKAETESNKLELEVVKQALLEDLSKNPIPTDLEQKEQFFMEQVALGEQISAKAKPGSKIDAAICFYKALAVYPNPTDILGIYQRSVPEDVYKVIVMMIAVQPPAAITNIMGTSEPEKLPAEEDLD